MDVLLQGSSNLSRLDRGLADYRKVNPHAFDRGAIAIVSLMLKDEK